MAADSSLVIPLCVLTCTGYPDLSLNPTIPPRPTRTGEEGPGGQTETMLNPLWLGLDLVMAGTSAEVPLPPDYEVRLKKIGKRRLRDSNSRGETPCT
uniref:Uncharacterized protein n=1 Tax=Brassica oleracea TaxID=3712 RepID=A0A3P6FC02_BRAOL|nr:unnamed protein product [Brassica oleracea]